MIGLVYSVRDPAGSGVAGYLAERLGLEKCDYAPKCGKGDKALLAGFEEDVIYFDFLDERLPPGVEYYVVLSRHSSEARIKSFTVHHTGNFGPQALYGGRPRELSIAYPKAAWALLRLLDKYRRVHGRGDFEVSYEATHHGPTGLRKPIIFIEIGSSEEEWRDPLNHAVLGDAVLEFLAMELPKVSCTPVIGIGGGHYPRKHSELALNSDTCFGHIMPKYALDYLDREILLAMKRRSVEAIKRVVVEKKGSRLEHRKLIEDFCDEEGLELVYI